jgi:predicted Rdx family selenoprotein
MLGALLHSLLNKMSVALSNNTGHGIQLTVKKLKNWNRKNSGIDPPVLQLYQALEQQPTSSLKPEGKIAITLEVHSAGLEKA